MLARPSPSGPLATLPGTSRIRLPPSSITPAASEAKAKVSHLHSNHTASRRTAIFTDSPLPMLAAEADHRRHAIVEQVIADLKNGPLAHLPSGRFNANGAWLILAAMAFNLLRAAGALASRFHARATTATIRQQLINVPARSVRSARRVHLRLPANWPWAADWLDLFTAATGPPTAVAA